MQKEKKVHVQNIIQNQQSENNETSTRKKNPLVVSWRYVTVNAKVDNPFCDTLGIEELKITWKRYHSSAFMM